MDNITRQRLGNSVHTNGQLESDEEALGWADTLLNFIEASRAPAASFLDVGCRSGYVMRRISERLPQAHVAGVDIVTEFLDEAQARSAHPVACCDAAQLPFEDRSVDWVFCAQTLEHVPRMPHAVSELCRVARLGQFISVPLERPGTNLGCGHCWHLLNPLDWLDYWQDSGFRLVWLELTPLLRPNCLNFITIRERL